jgi:hypothetical protein
MIRVGEIWAGSPEPGPEGPEKEGFLRMPRQRGVVSLGALAEDS